VWANAQVLESANAEASAIAVSFMVVSFVVQIRDNRTITNKIFVSCRCGRRCHSASRSGRFALKARNLAGMRQFIEQPGLIVICTTIGLIGLVSAGHGPSTSAQSASRA
jgi:hypothetical protein